MRIQSASGPMSSSRPPDSAGDVLVELTYEVARCNRVLRAWLTRRLGSRSIDDQDFWVLWLCRRAAPDGVVQHELAAAVGVSAAQMSGLVERLRQQGLLAGCRSEQDRRRQVWRLTTAGEELLREIRTEIGTGIGVRNEACSLQDEQDALAWLQRLANTIADPATAGITAVRGSPDPALSLTERSPESGRPTVGGFGEVGRPAPNIARPAPNNGRPAPNASASPSLLHTEAADERAHRRAS